MSWIWIIFSYLLLNGITEGRKGFGSGEQEWGYVEVRPSAKMFWWLYYVTPVNGENINVYEKPLIIWLQGGPGASSTGRGNFQELGPLDLDKNPRNHTWITDYNLLFIDNPVGSGFSYTESDSAFAKTTKQVGEDLLECIRGFLKEFPGFRSVSTYVIGQSYGGKMAVELGFLWYQTQKVGNITSNLKGIALGDAWISPIDSVLSWAPYLLHTGMIDNNGYKNISKSALKIKEAITREDWQNATGLYLDASAAISSATSHIDFYNILRKDHRKYAGRQFPTLDSLMNFDVKAALKLNVTWAAQKRAVFVNLRDEFMKPIVDTVKRLKDETDLEVFVYNGQLDLIVSTPGTLEWVERLFQNNTGWQEARRRPLVVDDFVEGYVKEYKNFKMYWVNRAGHQVPVDNPYATAKMLQHLTGVREQSVV